MEFISQVFLALGLLLILEGIPYFGFPERLSAWASRIAQMPSDRLRAGGIILMLAGLVVLTLRKAFFA